MMGIVIAIRIVVLVVKTEILTSKRVVEAITTVWGQEQEHVIPALVIMMDGLAVITLAAIITTAGIAGHVVADPVMARGYVNVFPHKRMRIVGTVEHGIAITCVNGTRVRMKENVVRGIQRTAATATVEPEHAVLHVAGDHVWVIQDVIPGISGAVVK